MKTVGLVLLVLLAATGFVRAALAETDPIPVEQFVKSLPKEFTHILIVGQVDNCAGFGCHLCPSDMTREAIKWDQCLSLSFEGFQDRNFPDNQGPHDNWVDVSGDMERAFRFATVVLDADYDPTCGPNQKPDADGSIVVCTDRASVIVNAKVVKVLSRKTAKDGISNSDWGRLAEPDSADKAAMSKLVTAGYPADRELKLFLVRGYPYLNKDLIAVGLGCFCLKDNCEKDWPARYFLGFDSSANPFRCVRLEKHPDGWRVSIFD